MRITLLIAAAACLALPAAPAAAGHAGRGSIARSDGVTLREAGRVRIHRGDPGRRDGSERFRRDERRFDRGVSDAYLPYRDYQGDTLWVSDGFNDWWHDRPDRAFPRWVSSNAKCERLWWSGGGWRC